MLVSQILKDKGDLVFTASPNETVGAAAALLHTRRVGAMVVLEEDETIAGILSERDIVRVIAEGGAAALSKPISTCMTRDVVFAQPEETVDALLRADDRSPDPPPAGLQGQAPGRHHLDRRPGEVQDQRGPGRGRGA